MDVRDHMILKARGVKRHDDPCQTHKDDCPWCDSPWLAYTSGYTLCGSKCHPDPNAKRFLIPSLLRK